MAEMTALERYRARKAAQAGGVNPPDAEKVVAGPTTAETEARPAASVAIQPSSNTRAEAGSSTAAPISTSPQTHFVTVPDASLPVPASTTSVTEPAKLDGRTKAGRAARAAQSATSGAEPKAAAESAPNLPSPNLSECSLFDLVQVIAASLPEESTITIRGLGKSRG